MDATQVLRLLNDYHRSVVFPAYFGHMAHEHMAFEQVRDVEYHFHVDKNDVRVTHTVCFFSSDRDERASVTIDLQPFDGAHMGAWVSHILDREDTHDACFRGLIGYSTRADIVDHLDPGHKSITKEQVCRGCVGLDP